LKVIVLKHAAMNPFLAHTISILNIKLKAKTNMIKKTNIYGLLCLWAESLLIKKYLVKPWIYIYLHTYLSAEK